MEDVKTSPPTPAQIEKDTKPSLPAATMDSPIKSNTLTTFSDMLNEVLLSKTSYARKFIQLKQLGLTEEEIRKVLKQYEMVTAPQKDDSIFLDTKMAKASSSGQMKAQPKMKKPLAKSKAKR